MEDIVRPVMQDGVKLVTRDLNLSLSLSLSRTLTLNLTLTGDTVPRPSRQFARG